MQGEMLAMENKSVGRMTNLPDGKKAVKTKWVYTINEKVDGRDLFCKARPVAKRFTTKEGINFFERYSPVSEYSTIRLVMAFAVHSGCYRRELDVKPAFLNADLNEKIYIYQPDGFEDPGSHGKVYWIYKPLYGLKQASPQLYRCLKTFLEAMGFVASLADAIFWITRS